MRPATGEGAIRRSFRLLRASWRLVLASRGLRGVAALAGVASFASLLTVFGGVSLAAADVVDVPPLVVVLVLSYPLAFVAVFMSVAVTAAAADAMDGRPASVRGALATAWARVPQIALWALLATGAGILLDSVIRRIPFVGKPAAWALGVAWAVATLFVVPVIALEGRGPRESLRRSARTVRERWGESLTGSLAIYAALLVVTIPACALLGAAGAIAAQGDTGPALAVGGTGLVLLSVAAVAGLVLRDVFGLALYRYATTGAESGGFTSGDFEAAMKRRRLVPDLPPALATARRRMCIAYGASVAILVLGVVASDLAGWLDEIMIGLLAAAALALLVLAIQALGGAGRRSAGLWLVAVGAAMMVGGIAWDIVDELAAGGENQTDAAVALLGYPLVLGGLALLSLRRSPTG